MIHHLSYLKGISVNDHILPEMKSVNYIWINDAISTIQLYDSPVQNMNDFPIGHIPLTNPFQNRTKQLKNLTSQCTTHSKAFVKIINSIPKNTKCMILNEIC
jgi:hypothetical protein